MEDEAVYEDGNYGSWIGPKTFHTKFGLVTGTLQTTLTP